MNKTHIILSALMGMSAVALGAFGAHGLKSFLSPELLETYRTGILYHLIHSVVLLVLSLINSYDFKVPFYFILIGIILFSFSLYTYTISSNKIFVMFTPIGGICLMIGWLLIAITVIRKKK